MKPAMLAVLSPITVGIVFRIIGYYRGRPLLGAEVLAGFLMFSTSTGILMALFLNNGGGAWDNAKKYIETGKCGGKGSEAHKASVTGDTVGDPFKDTSGPSLNILIKLMSVVSLVFAPVFPAAPYEDLPVAIVILVLLGAICLTMSCAISRRTAGYSQLQEVELS